MNIIFKIDTWQEIYYSLKNNKLRTFLTMIGVGWGMFLFVSLLGAAKGMENGFDTVSTVYIAYDEKLNPEQAIAYSDQLKKELKARKKVSPDDENAVVVRNRAEGLKDSLDRKSVV